MKALTIYQPWATLIALEVKPFEFRGWDYSTRNKTIQGARIAIHASARQPKYKEIADLVERMRAHQAACSVPGMLQSTDQGGTGLLPTALPILERILAGMQGRGDPFPLPLSAVVCAATLGRAVRAHTLFGGQTNDSDRDGHALWAWPMLAVKPTAPIDCRGAQGFWNVPTDVERELQRAGRGKL